MEQLLTDIDTFCKLYGMSESQFGILALNDKNFVPQIRDGRDLRFSTAEKCRDFMASHEKDAAA